VIIHSKPAGQIYYATTATTDDDRRWSGWCHGWCM